MSEKNNPENKKPIPVFTLDGVPFYKLKPITEYKDNKEQFQEIKRRMEALFEWSVQEGVPLLTEHISSALRVSSNAYLALKKGRVVRKGKYVRPDIAGLPEDECEYVRLRAEYIQSWAETCRMMLLTKVTVDTVPARSIYLAKSILHLWDSPVQTKEHSAFGMEAALLEKKARDAREKKQVNKNEQSK